MHFIVSFFFNALLDLLKQCTLHCHIMFKVGVIGLGNMGRHHVRHYAQLPDCELVGVCDSHLDRAEPFAADYSCQAVDCVDALIALGVEAVSVTVPTRFHFDVAAQLIAAGVHVLVEKPICETVEQAEKLIAQAQAANVTLMVGHIERFNPAVVALKQYLDAGKLGDIASVVVRRVGAFPTQIKDANVMIDLAVHDIDIVSLLMGAQPDRVVGNAGRVLIDQREDHAELFLTYGQKSSFIQVNWITPVAIRKLSVTGTRGYAELDFMARTVTVHKAAHQMVGEHESQSVQFGPTSTEVLPIVDQDPLGAELAHFVSCARTSTQPESCGQAGARALGVALDALNQLR